MYLIIQKMMLKLVLYYNLKQSNKEKLFQQVEITLSLPLKSIFYIILRAKQALYPIKRLYVLDAINVLMGSHKKVGKFMVRTFWNLLDHAKQRGFDPMRLWVHGCLIGKTKRYFNVRYAAKGRGAR